VDVTLEAGALSDTVEVSSNAGETVNTTSGEVVRVVDGQQVQDLSLNARNYLQVVTLIPGAPLLDDEDPLGQSVNGNTARPINGNRGNANNLTIDGGFNLDSGNIGNQTNNVGLDFIREVKIQTSNFSAEYGRQAGAAINIVTRGGTNQFHGSLYEFLRNEQLDANNFFSNASNLPRSPLRFNNFGYSLGGPVRKDKLFFFVGQEWKYVRQGILPLRRTLPTRRELAGDFSARAGLLLRDPLKTGACNAGNQTACFPGNVIPAGRITADGRAIAAFYLQSIGLAASFDDRPVANNAVFQNPSPYDFRQEFARIDYQLNDRHTIYGRYLHDRNINIDPLGINGGNQLPNVPTRRNRPGTGLLLAHIWAINPRLINEAKANASWNGQRIIAVETSADRAKYGFTFPQVFPAGGRFPNAIPAIDINGYPTAGVRGTASALISPATDISLTDNLSLTRGSHAFKTGLLVVRSRKDQNGQNVPYSGSISFNTGSNPNSTGNALADALLGNFRTYTEAAGEPYGFLRYTQFDAYATDNWKLNRRLSLELGVRYQYGQPFRTSPPRSASITMLCGPTRVTPRFRCGSAMRSPITTRCNSTPPNARAS